MPKWWVTAGPPENWEVAFNRGNVWGIVDRKGALWERLSSGDYILFYVTKPISGVIGYGVVQAKFKQEDKPLWPKEVSEGRVIWPYRFKFDVKYCLPKEKWMTHKVSSRYILKAASTGFQTVNDKEAEGIVQKLTSQLPK